MRGAEYKRACGIPPVNDRGRVRQRTTTDCGVRRAPPRAAAITP
jgi:hypothetical protein